LFENKTKFLIDYNFEVFEVLQSCLGTNLEFDKTTEFIKKPEDIKDFRHLVDGKRMINQFEPYTQVFEEKHGFLTDLSVLDLLFNEGRYAVDYLKKQELQSFEKTKNHIFTLLLPEVKQSLGENFYLFDVSVVRQFCFCSKLLFEPIFSIRKRKANHRFTFVSKNTP